MDRRFATSRAQDTRRQLRAARFSTELKQATVAAVRRLVAGLEWRRSASEWNDYQRTSTYTDAERELKAAFVARALQGKGARLVLDLGGNDGTYSRVAAAHAHYVVCADGDDLVPDGLCRSLRPGGNSRILPAYLDLSDPSPGRGWPGREHAGFFDRTRPDGVLALALLHATPAATQPRGTIPPRGCSSVGQSRRLITAGSQVRGLPAPPRRPGQRPGLVALLAVWSGARTWRTCGLRRLSQAYPGRHPRWHGRDRGHLATGPAAGRWLTPLRPQMRCRAAAASAAPAGGCGRSHRHACVGCIVWSTTASSSTVSVSRSVCWRSRPLNA